MSTIIFLLCSHDEVVWWASPRETNETYWDQFQFLMDFQPENLITYIKNVDANNKYHVLSISKQKTRKGFQSNKVHFSWLWHTWCWCSAKSSMLTWLLILISCYGSTVIFPCTCVTPDSNLTKISHSCLTSDTLFSWIFHPFVIGITRIPHYCVILIFLSDSWC